LADFLHFLYQWEKKNGHSAEHYKIYNFTLTMSSAAATVFAVREDRGRPLPASHLIDLIVCNFRRKSSKQFAF